MSLISGVRKVFQRVVTKVSFHYFNDNYLLSDQQFGFRPGRFTSNRPRLLNRSWQDVLDDSLDTVVVDLDIAGAFDRMCHGASLRVFKAISFSS